MRTRAILYALAVLDAYIDALPPEPTTPPLVIRAVLALLYLQSDGDRKPYDQFWSKLLWKGAGGPQLKQDGYERQMYARTYWYGIVRSVGLDPRDDKLQQAILIAQGRREDAALQRMNPQVGHSVRDAVYDREIAATKGRPHSEGGRLRMAENLAAGRQADGAPGIGRDGPKVG